MIEDEEFEDDEFDDDEFDDDEFDDEIALENDTAFISRINAISPSLYKEFENIAGIECPKDVYKYLRINSLANTVANSMENEGTSLYKYLLFISETKKMFKLKNLNVPEIAVLMIYLLSPNPALCRYSEFKDSMSRFFGYFGAHKGFLSLEEKGVLISDLDADGDKYYSLAPEAVKELEATLELRNFTGKLKPKKKAISNNAESTSNEFHSKSTHIVPASKMKVQKLIYDEETESLIKRVQDILSPENYEDIKKRLLKTNTGSSICISLYGESGTGKTESVFQMAKSSGRDVFNYVISESESQWAGAQSSAIHKMFGEYQQVCEEYEAASKPIPILLLNEADALFGKRTSDPHGGYEKELNHIQAELLNHMDGFKGIMFITTNVFDCFDDAFSRRFLFKVQFNSPDKDTQKKIWKLNFKSLNKEDISNLVSRFNMTGGNIANVKKKLEINYIIYGKDASLSDIIEACKSEKSEIKTSHIGFAS